jgi:hypothetical protein
MLETVASKHIQIARQIRALERAVLAFQPVMVGAVGGPGALDTNIAIILSARLANVWKRIGKTLPRRPAAPGRAGPVLARKGSGPRVKGRGRTWTMMG